MATKIDTVTGRDKLTPRHAPYWQKVRAACHIGFRKTTAESTGAWIARYRDDDGKYQLNSLGSLEAYPGHLRFDEAVKQAEQWFDHRDQGGAAVAITVGDACTRYRQKQLDERKLAAVKDLDARFKRWMFSDKKLSNTLLTKLSKGQITDWRNKLSKGLAIPQDKTKERTEQRAASTINREMAVFKAALNLAVRDGYCTTDTAWKHQLTPIKNATGRRDCYLDPDQRRALINNTTPDLAAFLKALSLVPFRPGAMAALTAGSFDKRLGVLTVGKDKSGKDRKINLPPSTAAFFAEQVKGKLPTAPLLARSDGRFWDKDSWKYPFKDALLAANLPIEATAYALRHSTITDLIALHHLDTMTVALLSGTSVLMIEKHYGHLLRDHAADALAKLAL